MAEVARAGAHLLAAALIVSSLLGCATREEQEAEARKSAEAAKAQCASLFSGDGLRPLRGKVALGQLDGRSPSNVLAGSVSDEEKTALELWFKSRDQCWSAQQEWYAKEPAVFTDVANAAILVENGLIAKLYLGQLTYRQFTAKRTPLVAAAKETLNELEHSGTRFHQRQIADEFIATCKRQIDEDAMADAMRQMRAQMSDPAKCHTVGGKACI